MVHLAAIPADEQLVEATKKVQLQLSNDEDCYTTSVYGSRFAAADLPKHEMPEGEMPKEVAYRMIKDELSLDGNPMLK
jgi:glutamate decarboxylase